MALKGTATIELTDVRTGRKEVIKHDNLVTNAVSDILGMNPFGVKFMSFTPSDGNLTGAFGSYALPVYINLLGGILLYERSLKADPAAIYAGADNPLIGYSSNDVNPTADKRRGSLNLNESGPLTDGKGYRYVFDFSTDQANGTIAALGLTSSYAGKAGYGSEFEDKMTNLLTIYAADSDVSDSSALSTAEARLAAVVSIDPTYNFGYFARVIAANTIEVGKIRLPIAQIGLTSNPRLPDMEAFDIRTITTANFCGVYSTSSYNYSTLIDGGDDYIWGFQHEGNAAGNSSGNATVLWVKIRKSDWSYEEGKWSIPATLYPFGKYYASAQISAAQTNVNYSIINDGVLYAIKYASNAKMSGVYMIPLSNPTDITLIESDVGAQDFSPETANGNFSYRIATAVNNIAGVVSYRYFYVEGKKLKYKKSGALTTYNRTQGLSYINKPGLQAGPYLLGFGFGYYTYGGKYNTRYSPAVYIPACYLATVNNLETPVTKTADKTMKITYILREE